MRGLEEIEKETVESETFESERSGTETASGRFHPLNPLCPCLHPLSAPFRGCMQTSFHSR
jgi:hypothetical protein